MMTIMNAEETLRRLDARLDDAHRRWSEEKKTLEAEIEQWRAKLAEQCGKTLAAHHVAARRSRELTHCVGVLKAVRAILQEPISMQQRQYMLKLITTALKADDNARLTDAPR